MIIRKFQIGHDRDSIADLNATFRTDRIFDVAVSETGMNLSERVLAAPFIKTYAGEQIIADLEAADHAVVAEISGTVTGIASVKLEQWNNRADLTGLYVAPESRQMGVGRQLVVSAIEFAKSARARCLWVETQNTNYPAIQFYKKMGFRLCGFDSTLYNHTDGCPGEIALFFVLAF